MPIIFAQAIMFIPITLAGFGSSESSSGFYAASRHQRILVQSCLLHPHRGIHLLLHRHHSASHPDGRGHEAQQRLHPRCEARKENRRYLDSIMSRITLPGSLFLGIVAILPAFARFFGISQNFAQFFGGTSLLILVVSFLTPSSRSKAT